MPTEQAASPLANPLIPGVIIFLIFYFVLIKPQKEKQKAADKMKQNVQKNDKIVSSGGIHGTVVMLKDKSVIVRIDDNVKIEIDKESIASIIKTNGNEGGKKKVKA